MGKIYDNFPQKILQIRDEYRDKIDLLHSRVNLLTGKDRLLMEMYLEKGTSFKQMARLIGTNELRIARRIRNIIKRLIDDKYIICLQHRTKFGVTEMGIAKEHFLLGLSMREIAAKRHISYYKIREIIGRFNRLIKVTESGTEEQRHKG